MQNDKNTVDELFEIEKKYLVSKQTAFSLIEKGIATKKHSLSFINQIYLFKNNAIVYYNLESNSFEITLNYSGEVTETLIIPITNENKVKQLQECFSDHAWKNLTELDAAFRIRYSNGLKPEFAMKMKLEGKAGVLEIEEELTDIYSQMIDLNQFESVLKSIQSRIVKIRHKVERNGFVYEIDMYSDFNFVTLEIEFENENQYKDFIADFDIIEDISEDSSYKNKSLSKKLMD